MACEAPRRQGLEVSDISAVCIQFGPGCECRLRVGSSWPLIFTLTARYRAELLQSKKVGASMRSPLWETPYCDSLPGFEVFLNET
jgi:hypothetical protein